MKRVSVVLIVTILAAVMSYCQSSGQVEAAQARLIIREVSLGRLNPDVYPDTITVSPDGKRVAYAAIRGDNTIVVVDGVAGNKHDLVGYYRLSFSPDSKRLAYSAPAVDSNEYCIVVDGVEGQKYGWVGRPRFSSDGKHIAYAAYGRDGTAIVTDGVEGKQYDRTGWPRFSPDGKRLAYAAQSDGKWMMVVNGVEGRKYDDVGRSRFSPDSKRLAYPASRGDKAIMVVDGVEIAKGFDEVEVRCFSPDSKRFAYAGRRGDSWSLVVDGVEGEGYEWIGHVDFSPDSRRVGYLAQPEGEGWRLVLDGVEGEAYDLIPYFCFNSTGERTAHQVDREDSQFVVVDGVEGKTYKEVGRVYFTSDGKQVVYSAKLHGKWIIVVGEEEVREYDFLLQRGEIHFDAPRQLRFAAVRNGAILRVEIEIAGGEPAHIRTVDGKPAEEAEKYAGLTLNTTGGDSWTWRKEITARCSCDDAGNSVSMWVNGTELKVERKGKQFSALVPLAEGENRMMASCRNAEEEECDSKEIVFTQRLKSRPTARISVSIGADGILLNGEESTPCEASGAAIVNYAWRARKGNPARVTPLTPVGGALQKSLLLKPPVVDGEYYFSLEVTDAEGREDKAMTYFAVEDGKPRLVNWETENASWLESAVIYGAVPHIIGDEGFRSVTEKLDYLKDLGVDAIWLAPSNMTLTGNGYAVSDYFKLTPDYGSEADFRQMIREAHAREIRVLMDFVPNHSSIRHPYMRHAMAYGTASPHFHFFDREAAGRGAYTYYFDWEDLPNLNYDNTEVRRWMTEAFSYWVREFDVDGFRVDAPWGVKERTPSFWPEWRRELQRIKPDFLPLAEASARDSDYFTDGFDAAYDWTDELGHWSMENVFDDETKIVERLHEALTNEGRGFHEDALIFRFLNNNDTGRRFITRHGLEMTRVAAAMLLTLPGLPCVYTGQEIGAEFHPYRTPYPISWEDKFGLRNYYKKLIALRKQTPSLHSRKWEILEVESAQQVYAYVRYGKPGDKPVLVILNFSDQRAWAEISAPKQVSVALSGQWRDLLTFQRAEISRPKEESLAIAMPASTAMILMEMAD